MNLKKYAEKRSVSSPEPKAKVHHRPKKSNLQFVVQKHAASHLHYDFRLEVDGVLKSWAVPKGLSLDPQVKHLAMMVEDHPYDYRTFEGVIPEGYGAGTVMVWDYGTYSVGEKSSSKSEELIKKGIREGHFHFILSGEKLKGEFILVKMNRGKENEWLIMKKQDAFSTKEDVLELDCSAVTGRTLEEISQGDDPKPSKKIKSRPKQSCAVTQKKDPMPHHIEPMLATLAEKPFDNTDWIFEIKMDGFRALAEIKESQVELYSRNQLSFVSRFPTIVSTLKKLKKEMVLDGEIVCLDPKGVSHFQMLQNWEENAANTYYYVFDLLYLDGEDLRKLPLEERKARLKTVLGASSNVRYLEDVKEEGEAFYALCKEKKLEGVMAKKSDSFYSSGKRSKEWLKIKIQMRQEAMICGFTEPKNSRKYFGALIIGVYEKAELQYVGHVGGGFKVQEQKEIKELLDKHIIKKSPFKTSPKTNTAATWVTPMYICEVEFKEWTKEGVMRQPIYLGLRYDKSPKLVTKEIPIEQKLETIHKKQGTIANQKTTVQKTITRKLPRKSLNGSSFITHPDKIFWEDEKITKGDVLNYYKSISKYILPYLQDRPEILKRFPNGISKPSFYQKNLQSHPDWITTVPIQHQGKIVEYLVISDLQSLLYAVNLDCIEIHSWFSRCQSLEYPDFMIFDLDPEDIAFESVIETALVLHEILDQLKIPNFCKTSGSTGLHIGVPLGALYTFEQAKNFALIIANLAHQEVPKITSLERSPRKRQKKVYIDCLQNNFGQSLAVPYSLRAKSGAPVSMPVDWKELKQIHPSDFTLFNALERIKSQKDLFRGILLKGINLESILKNLKVK